MPISYPTPLSERIAMLEGTRKKKKKRSNDPKGENKIYKQ